MIRLRSFVCNAWEEGTGDPRVLLNPSTEEGIAETTTQGIDFAAALQYARKVGGPALRALTFVERGAILTKMANVLHEKREYLLDVSRDCNGATRGDSKFDVDGATATLSAYGKYGSKMGDRTFQVDGDPSRLSSNARHVGQHIRVARPGVAVHINAFNFPTWGTFEKIATAILAGMPVVTKPATATSWLTYEAIKIVIDSGIVPAGALSFIAGSAGDMLAHLGPQDVVAFTGAASTAAMLRQSSGVLHKSARFNAEADSLNAAVLGADVEVGSDIWYKFINNVFTDMTQKAGQKCTAVRRLIVPESLLDAVEEQLLERLGDVVVGYPTERRITMGPVASLAQLRDVRAGIDELSVHATVLCGGSNPVQGENAPEGKGCFVAPTLLRANDADSAIFHDREVFGPCATILPYDGSHQRAVELVAKGEGCLVSSIYSDDRKWLSNLILDASSWNGRLHIVSTKVADSMMSPGTVLANQVHGGPGRAGGGEELGGLRGLDHYTNRTAVQGDRALLNKLLDL